MSCTISGIYYPSKSQVYTFMLNLGSICLSIWKKRRFFPPRGSRRSWDLVLIEWGRGLMVGVLGLKKSLSFDRGEEDGYVECWMR